MTPERQDELVGTYAKQLQDDLAWAAPEMWPVHIRRRMEELADELLEDPFARTLGEGA